MYWASLKLSKRIFPTSFNIYRKFHAFSRLFTRMYSKSFELESSKIPHIIDTLVYLTTHFITPIEAIMADNLNLCVL